jgi:AdoMet-dependent heme synthase
MTTAHIFDTAPRRVYWEVTRACDLACRHCRAEAAPTADPEELTPEEGQRVLHDLARFGAPRPHLVLTGGDPLKRADLFPLIETAKALGFPVAVAPSGTPRLTAEEIRRLAKAGVEAISLSLDGSTAARHDALRGVPGCFGRTLEAARLARDAGLPFQVNTLVSRETLDDLRAIHQVVRGLGAARWSLFFLVSVGRGTALQPISAEECEALFVELARLAGTEGPVITTTEAPHFRRVVLEQRRRDRRGSAVRASGHPRGAAAGIRDGNGIMFIDHTGLVCPSGFFPLPAGNVRREGPVAIYRQSPLFRALRRPDLFGGRCGRCEYRTVCGGSRARAFAATGDPLGEDPLCAYQPAARAAAEPLPQASYQGRIAGAYSSTRSPTAMSGSIP